MRKRIITKRIVPVLASVIFTFSMIGPAGYAGAESVSETEISAFHTADTETEETFEPDTEADITYASPESEAAPETDTEKKEPDAAAEEEALPEPEYDDPQELPRSDESQELTWGDEPQELPRSEETASDNSLTNDEETAGMTQTVREEETTVPVWDNSMCADLEKNDVVICDDPDEDGFQIRFGDNSFYAGADVTIRVTGRGEHDLYVKTDKEITLELESQLSGRRFTAGGNGQCHILLRSSDKNTGDAEREIRFEEICAFDGIRLDIRPEQDFLMLRAGRIICPESALISAPEGVLQQDPEEDRESEIIQETESPDEEESETLSEEESESISEKESEIQRLSLSVSKTPVSLMAATPGTGEYGKDPFDLEYSSGAIIKVDAKDTKVSGMTGPITMTNASADSIDIIYIGTNTKKSADVYKDFYGGAVMGQDRYDVRIYTWGKDDAGQGYGVMDMGFTALGSSNNTYSNGAVYTHSPTKIWMEYHFYKEGTLKTSSPQEVSFKGTIRYNDLDIDEGYAFIQGFAGAWTDGDSTIKKKTDSDGVTWYMGTALSEVGMTQEAQTLWVQVNSTKSVPYTCIYDANTSYGSSASASTVSIKYKLTKNSEEPKGFVLPEGETYHAKYGSYKVEKIQEIEGYTFTGWNTSSDLTGTEYAKGQTIVTDSNVTLWGEYVRDPVLVRPVIRKKDAVSGKEVSQPGMAFVIHDTGGAFAEYCQNNMTEKQWKDYQKKYGDLIVAEDGTGQRDKPFVTAAGKNSSTAFVIPGVLLPEGTYALEETKAPEGYICHGYEGTYREKGSKTFAEAKNMADPKWAGSIFAGDENRTGTWAGLYKNLPALVTFKISESKAYHENGGDDWFADVTLEDESAKGKISVFVQKEELQSFEDGKDQGSFVYKTVPAAGCTFEVRAVEDIMSVNKAQAGKPLFGKGDKVVTLVTDENGEAWSENVKASDGTSLAGLPCGSYEIVMTGPENLLNDEAKLPRRFEISYADDRTPILYEDALYTLPSPRFDLYGMKTDQETGEAVKGALLGLYTASPLTDDEGKEKVGKDTLVSTITTSLEKTLFPGNCLIDGADAVDGVLPEGEYYVKEIEAPVGYYPDKKTIAVSMPAMDGQTVTVKDAPIEARFFLKDDLTYNELADAQFVVTDEEGNEVDVFITNDTKGEGRLLCGLKSGGVYTITERLAREGYKNTILGKNGEEIGTQNRFTFTVPEDPQPFVITLYNAFVTGDICLVKRGDTLRSISSGTDPLPYTLFGYKEDDLSGAEFKVYAAEDIVHPDGITGIVTAKDKLARMNVRGKKRKAVCISGSDGKVVFSKLYPGHYIVKETKAPEGFTRLSKPLDVYIGTGEGDQTLSTKVSDKRQQILVTVLKKEKGSGKDLEGALFGLYANSNITSFDGKILIRKGSLIEQGVTDKNGRLQFKAKLPHGKYFVREIEAPEGYELTSEEFSFEAAWSDSKKETLTYSHTFYDTLIVKETPAPGKGKTPTPAGTPQPVKTADNTPLAGLVTAMALSLGAAVAVLGRKRKTRIRTQ